MNSHTFLLAGTGPLTSHQRTRPPSFRSFRAESVVETRDRAGTSSSPQAVRPPLHDDDRGEKADDLEVLLQLLVSQTWPCCASSSARGPAFVLISATIWRRIVSVSSIIVCPFIQEVGPISSSRMVRSRCCTSDNGRHKHSPTHRSKLFRTRNIRSGSETRSLVWSALCMSFSDSVRSAGTWSPHDGHSRQRLP